MSRSLFAGWPVRLLAALPVGGSLVISFAGLADLARSARITGHLAYIWPLSWTRPVWWPA